MGFEPWVKYPALSKERLMAVGSIIREARCKVVLLHLPADGDDEWSLGCRAYARTCFAIRQAERGFDWLEVLPDKQWLRFTFAIGGIPVRFYRGDPTDPPIKAFSVCYTELRQLRLAFEMGVSVPANKILRIAVETDANGYASTISLLELTEENDPAEIFEIPAVTTDQSNIVPFQTKAIDLPPPTVEPLKKDDDEQQRSERDAS